MLPRQKYLVSRYSSITASVTAAEQAFAHWRSLSVNDRAARLHAWHDLLHEHREDLAAIMTREQGKPLGDARGEVDYGASFIHELAC